jgi:NAD(P)H-flavin reductase
MPSAPKWVFDVAQRLLPKLPLMEVINIDTLSPTLKIIRFKADLQKMNFQIGSYIDFRVSDTEVRRYTASFVDYNSGYLEFIIHLHNKGEGSIYMNNLKVGDKINNNQPRAYKYYDNSADKYVIFGDETSLGLARSFLSVLKNSKKQFQFYL